MTQGAPSYSVAEAEHRFRELIARAGAGERVVIVRRGTPVAVVVPPDELDLTRSSRPVGLAAVAGGLSDYPDLDELVGKRSDSTAHAAELERREAVRARLRRKLAVRIRSGDGIDRGDDVLEASRSGHR